MSKGITFPIRLFTHLPRELIPQRSLPSPAVAHIVGAVCGRNKYGHLAKFRETLREQLMKAAGGLSVAYLRLEY